MVVDYIDEAHPPFVDVEDLEPSTNPVSHRKGVHHTGHLLRCLFRFITLRFGLRLNYDSRYLFAQFYGAGTTLVLPYRVSAATVIYLGSKFSRIDWRST